MDDKLVDSYFATAFMLGDIWVSVCKCCGSVIHDDYRTYHAGMHYKNGERPHRR